jgi:hypothetical protein
MLWRILFAAWSSVGISTPSSGPSTRMTNQSFCQSRHRRLCRQERCSRNHEDDADSWICQGSPARNLRGGDLVGLLPASLLDAWFSKFSRRFQTWRSTETGDWLFERSDDYDNVGWVMKMSTKSRPLSHEEVRDATAFVSDIGGRVVFTVTLRGRPPAR